MGDIVNTPFDIPLGQRPFVCKIAEFPNDAKYRGSYIIAEGDSKVTAGTPLERKRYLVRLVVEHDPGGQKSDREFLVVPAGCPVSDCEKLDNETVRLHFVTMARNPYTDAVPVCIYEVEHELPT